VRSWKRPSNAGGSATCAGAFCVAASRCRRNGRLLSSGDERARASGALFVCAEIWKLPLREEALEEREMFACKALVGICQRDAQIEG
jgi:hypothetical protein